MTKKTKSLPVWYPLDIYSKDLSQAEWAKEITFRLKFLELHVEGKDPPMVSPWGQPLLDWVYSERKDLSSAWVQWFATKGDLPDKVYMLRGDDDFYVDGDTGRTPQDQAVKVMTGYDAIYLGSALAENKALLASAFNEMAEFFHDEICKDANAYTKGYELGRIQYVAPLVCQAIQHIEETPITDIEKDRPYYEFLDENKDKESVFAQVTAPTEHAWIGVDLGLDDDTILDGMRQKLKQIRGVPELGKRISQNELNKWRKYEILQVFDLNLWADINGINYTRSFIANTIWPHSEVDTVEQLRRPIESKIKEVFNWDTVTRLKNTPM